MKRIFALALGLIMTFSMGTVCFAAEEQPMYGNADRITIERSAEDVYEVTDVEATTSRGARLSWGEGVIHSQDPLFANPSAYAETKTYSGTAYCMYVRLGLIDGDGISYSTDESRSYTISTITSATLLSPTAHCEFIGDHGIQDTQNSGWQTANTYKDY